MKSEILHIGMKVHHPQYGLGVVRAITEHTAEIRFDDGAVRTISPDTSGLEPTEAMATVSGLNVPLLTFVQQAVEKNVQFDFLGR